MRPEIRRRICWAVFVGLIAMIAAAIVVIMVLPVGSPRTPRLILGLTIVSLLMWFLLAPLALLAVRLSRELRLPDVIVGTVLLLLILQAAVLVVRLDAKSARLVDGELCNGNSGRKLVTSSPVSDPRFPIYYSCVPVAEYEAERAAKPAPTASRRASVLSAHSIFDRLLASHFASRGLFFGTVIALTAWLYAFGWRWRVRTDEL